MKKVLAIALAVCMFAALGVTGFAEAASPWADLDIAHVIFVDGTKDIKAADFAGLADVEDVMLPASVESIEDGAFADSAVAVVKAVDAAVLEGVEAFADAEVEEISQDDFDAAVDEVLANATIDEDAFAYCEETKTLLVKGAVEEDEDEKPAVYTYSDSGSSASNTDSQNQTSAKT